MYSSTPQMESGLWMNSINQSHLLNTAQDPSMNPFNFTSTTEDPIHRYNRHMCKLFYSFLITSLFAGLLCLFGFLGNFISYFILSRDQNTSPVAAFLLKSLAFTDNFFLFNWFIQCSLADAFAYTGAQKWLSPGWLYVRTYGYPLMFVGQTATIWMTVLIAANRFIAVCVPYRASVYCSLNVTRWSVASVLIFSFLYNVPRFFETTIVEKYHPRLNTTYLTFGHTAMGGSRMYQLVYFDILYYIFSFVLPLLLLSLFNTRLILAYRRVEQRRARMMRMRSRASQSHDQNITLIMIVVIIVFMLCNAPARLVQLIWQYAPAVDCPGVAFFVTVLSNVLEVFSSSTNFFIYCAFRKQFRQILRRRTRSFLSSVIGSKAAERLLGKPGDSGGEYSDTCTAGGQGGKSAVAMCQTQVQRLEITCATKENDVKVIDDKNFEVKVNGNHDVIGVNDVTKENCYEKEKENGVVMIEDMIEYCINNDTEDMNKRNQDLDDSCVYTCNSQDRRSDKISYKSVNHSNSKLADHQCELDNLIPDTNIIE